MVARQRKLGRNELLPGHGARWILLLFGIVVTTASFVTANYLTSQPHVPRTLGNQNDACRSLEPAGGAVRTTYASSAESGGVAVARLQIQSPSELAINDAPPSAGEITISPDHGNEQMWINPHVGNSQVNLEPAQVDTEPAAIAEPPPEMPPVATDAVELDLPAPPEPLAIDEPAPPSPAPAFDLTTDENGPVAGREAAMTSEDWEPQPAAPTVETWIEPATTPAQPAVRVEVTAIELSPESVQHVTGMVREALGQAERGALYLSRKQLLESLRTMSWMLDREAGGRLHATALAAALRALDEADDFSLASVDYLTDSAMDSFIAGHGTSVLKSAQAPNPLEAREAYYAFARDALVTACGSEPIGAQALYSLARVEAELRARAAAHHRSGPRELALYEAALVIHPQHAVAANELGVALARDGQLARSVQWFERSATAAPNPKVLANLTKVHSQLGNHRAASSVQNLLARHRGSLTAPGHAAIPLVTIQQFNAQLRPDEAQPVSAADGNATHPPGAGRSSQATHVGYFPQVPKPRQPNAIEVMARRLFSGKASRSK